MGGAGKAVDQVMGGEMGWATTAATPFAKPWWEAARLGKSLLPKAPDLPGVPEFPVPPDLKDEAIRNAKLAERRRQLGLTGRKSTWLTGARGDTNSPEIGTANLLGGRSTLLGS